MGVVNIIGGAGELLIRLFGNTLLAPSNIKILLAYPAKYLTL
jgi:hypothetical protein